MISKIFIRGLSPGSGARGQGQRGASPAFRKTLGIILAAGLAPLAMWLVGTAIVRVAPPVYQSEAVLRVPASAATTANPVATPAVIDEAATTLGAKASHDPMATQVLRSQLTLKRDIGPQVIKVAARGHDPQEARRTLMAVVESYEHQHAAGTGAPLLVYAAPLESAPVAVPHGMRLVLGCAGLALAGLLLSIPLLRKLEGVPLVQSGRELVNAIARACAAAGLPRVGGYLPAAQPAG
jgi:hypothetical protein